MSAQVQLLAHSYNPTRLVAQAAKLCYSKSTIQELGNDLSDEKAKSFVEMLSQIGHESPIEHVSFTFGIEGVSRAFLAQITRHRIASYSVQSQRYVKEDQFEYVIPPEIAADKEAAALFIQTMEAAQKSYDTLSKMLTDKHFEELTAQGLDQNSARKNAEKMAIEDARFVLPNACATKMIVTMNARSLQNFFNLRCCNRAQWEIREVANQMLRLVNQAAPELFAKSGPSCISGGCPEGKMTCGKIEKVRKFYKELKQKAEE